MILSIVPEIAEMQKEIGPGKCPFCEDPLPPWEHGRSRCYCLGYDCDRTYHRLYRAERSKRNWAKGLTANGRKRTA